MKILIIPSWYPNKNSKFAGIFFYKQAELLSKGHDVRILVANENLKGYRNVFGNPSQLFIKKYRSSNFFLDTLTEVRLYQFEIDNFAFHSEKKQSERLVNSYISYFKKNVYKEWVPDIIHAHDVFSAGLVACAIKKLFKIPIVITSHNPIHYDLWSSFQIKEFKRIIIEADCVTTVSDFDKRIMLISSEREINPITIGNYIDENIFNALAKEQNSCFKFLYVASSSRRKDFPSLIKAFDLLKQNCKKHFILQLIVADVNDGITLIDIQNLIDEYNLTECIKIQSQIPLNNGLLSLYQEADLFISSSYYETFGVAVAEALCCGIPVISADNGGVRDIIDHGINGWIVPMKDPKILAEYILKFMNDELKFDPTLLRASIVNKFGSAVFLTKLINIYKSILHD